jgi:hypothetical protein
VLREGNREWELVADASRWVPAAQPLPPGARARGPLERALKEGMFTVPFGPSYWRGYQAGAAGRPQVSVENAPAAAAAPSARRFLPALAVPAWAVAAGLGGALLAVAAGGAVATYEYKTTTYQRQSILARTTMLGTGMAGLVLAALLLAAVGVSVAVTAVTFWLS